MLRRPGRAGGIHRRIQAKLAAANTGFAFDLLKQIAGEQPNANIFISPFSVSSVLQMVANGAAGDTKTEMQRVLKTAGLAPDALNAACKDLNQSLNSQTNVILNLANAIWFQEGFHLKPGFVATNSRFFQAELAPVDFKKPESAQIINDWADNSTHGKIKDIVRWPFDPLTRVILANAIYFKGKWDRPFDKQATKDHAFILPGGTQTRFRRCGNRDISAIRKATVFKPCGCLMPADGCRCISFCRTRIPVRQNSWPAWTATPGGTKSCRDFATVKGTLAFPRFKLEYDVVLNDPLEALGMRHAFDDADFSAMAGEPLFVSEVKQKSFVEVNEEGTEAAG